MYPAHKKAKFTISEILLKITKQGKKQESKVHSEEKNQSSQTVAELTKTLELSDKDDKQ